MEDESRVDRDLVCVRLDGALKGADSILYGRQLAAFAAVALRDITMHLVLDKQETLCERLELG